MEHVFTPWPFQTIYETFPSDTKVTLTMCERHHYIDECCILAKGCRRGQHVADQSNWRFCPWCGTRLEGK